MMRERNPLLTINLTMRDRKRENVYSCFFFSSRRRHTRSDRDWSSDVCSSDLVGASRRAERLGVEGFGIALVEASACGRPVVAGNSGGIPDAVRDGETGFLVPPEEPAAFADAICRLLADPAAANRMGQNGRRAVETYFNWDRVVRDLREIESQVVGRA